MKNSKRGKDSGGVRNSASLRSLHRLRLGHITADKREIKDFPKLHSATSFIRKTLGVIFEGSLFSNLDLTRRVKKLLNKLNLSDYHG